MVKLPLAENKWVVESRKSGLLSCNILHSFDIELGEGLLVMHSLCKLPIQYQYCKTQVVYINTSLSFINSNG